MKANNSKYLLSLIVLLIHQATISAQDASCIFKDTLLRIDFGSVRAVQEFNLKALKAYQRSNSECPDDGYYSYSSRTSDCFNGDWITLNEDHTPGDIGGKMFFVNASYRPAVFFIAGLSGFKTGTTYEFGVWMLNLRKLEGGCTPIPPNIVISLETPDGKRLTAFQTGKISPVSYPSWKKYYAMFTTPVEPGALTLKMEDVTEGGCGNDFAMDDITFRECYPPEPPVVIKAVKPQPKPELKPSPVVKTTGNQVIAPAKPLSKERLDVSRKPIADSTPGIKKITRAKAVSIPLPDVIANRENPIVRKIQIEPADLKVELYDNGQVDGDTVSIYHNNELIVSRAGLSEKPVSFRIRVDGKEPYHEIVMVANNLGSIPPNTSLMIITGNGKRFETFISSSEQKNAKLVIELKP